MQFVRYHWRGISIVILAPLVVFLAVPLLMRWWAAGYTYADASDAPASSVVIVLGASVYQGEPSPVLAERAQEAVELYVDGKVPKILVSGDNSALNHNEVEPVKNYLLAAGISGQDIFLDHAGFDTYSSMYRAKYIFGVQSAIIATQSFHMPRALFLARALGLNAVGVVADEGDTSAYDYVREIPASWKALWDVLTHRRPEYLGAQIPLSGNGESTW